MFNSTALLWTYHFQFVSFSILIPLVNINFIYPILSQYLHSFQFTLCSVTVSTFHNTNLVILWFLPLFIHLSFLFRLTLDSMVYYWDHCIAYILESFAPILLHHTCPIMLVKPNFPLFFICSSTAWQLSKYTWTCNWYISKSNWYQQFPQCSAALNPFSLIFSWMIISSLLALPQVSGTYSLSLAFSPWLCLPFHWVDRDKRELVCLSIYLFFHIYVTFFLLPHEFSQTLHSTSICLPQILKPDATQSFRYQKIPFVVFDNFFPIKYLIQP